MPEILEAHPSGGSPRRTRQGQVLTVALALVALAASAGREASAQRPGPEKRLPPPNARASRPPAPAEGIQAPTGPHPSVAVAGGEEAFDFGSVWPGEALKHTFKLTNRGDAELVILHVKPG